MAYIPRNFEALRQRWLGQDTSPHYPVPSRPSSEPPSFVGAGGGAGGGGLSSPQGTGRFAALRGFFEANAPGAEAAATGIAKPIEETAQSAVADSAGSARRYENEGGATAAEQAQAERDKALEQVRASGSYEGLGELLGEGRGQDYTPGMKSADAWLYGRTGAIGDLQKWQPVLEALSPTYRPGDRPVPPKPPQTSRPAPERDPGRPAWNPETQRYEYPDGSPAPYGPPPEG